MNTNSINTISKYLLLLLLILTGASCNDNDDAEDTSIPVLISQNINDGDVVGPSGYVELTFSKAMRQAPDTEIYFNGDVCFGQSMGDALYIYDSAGGDYLDMVNTGTANVNAVVFVK